MYTKSGGSELIRFLMIVLMLGILIIAGETIANDKGMYVFKKCQACHNFKKNKLGPHLKGIVGREIASVEGYKYSKAMLEYQGFVWDEDNLSIWLQNPKKMISKTKMIFPGLKKQDQIDALIEYLKSK